MAGESTHTTVTLLFTDVEGSTALRTSKGDEVAHRLLAAQEAIVREQVAKHDGRQVKSTGDGFLVAFASARKALVCAIGIQDALRTSPIRVRIGLNAGEAMEQDGDLFGEAVNAAARIMSKADGGEILVSDVVRQLAGTTPDVEFADRGRFALKGFPDRWRLYAISSRAPVRVRTAPPAPPIVGRSAEIDVLRGVLDAASAGTGRVAVLEGEAGIGKSRLGRAVVDIAKDLGFLTFVGTAHELERERAFGAVIDAFGLRAEAEDPMRKAVVSLLADEEGDKRFPIIERVIELVESLAMEQPVLILAEDLHWADSSTILTLHRLSSTIRHLPVAIICTTRPEPRSTELATLLKTLDAQFVALGPLSEEAVAELAQTSLGASPGPHLLEQLGGAAGNPLFVTELVAALTQEGLVDTKDGEADVGDVSMPPSLRLTILRRLASLSEPTLETLRMASVLGTTFSLTDLCSVTGKAIGSIVPLIDEAAATGLVGETGSLLRFRHDLVRDAIYEDMLEPIRKALHAQTARALAGAGAPASQVASHAAIGAVVGDVQAAGWLRNAALEIAPRAPLASIGLLEKALELVGRDTSAANEIRLTLAWSYVANERGREAVATARELLSAHPDPTKRLSAQCVLARTLPGEDAIREIDDALRDPSLEPADEARLVAERALVLNGDSHDHAQASAEAQRAIRLAEATGNDAALFLATTVMSFCFGFEGSFGEALDWSEKAQRLAPSLPVEESRFARFQAWSQLQMVWADRFDDAMRSLESIRVRGAEAGEALTNVFYYASAMLELWSGRWDDAVTIAETQASLFPDVYHPHQPLAYIAIHRDELDAAASHLPDLPGALWIPALLAEARGDSAGLDSLLEKNRPNVDLTTPWNIGVGLWTLPEWVRLYFRAGDRAYALKVTEVLEAASARARTSTARGAALRCRGLVENDAETLLAAVDEYRSGPRVFDLASTCEWAAGCDGVERGRAVALLEEALATYEAVGCRRDIARAEASLRKLGVRRGRRGGRQRPKYGWDSLTPTEQRVTALVSEGLSYREAGDRLFISRRTVETHVVHIFAKLGIASRRDLAELARERGIGADALTEQA